MIDFPTLYPSLVKYLPNWSERFYPSLAQFARGEGYPCGNQGVFIPRRNKCWTHPKTGQRLKKPLTYQMYKDAKEKSQRSRTEKGRTALETREQSFRDKAREKVKGWQKNKPQAEVKQTPKPKSHSDYYGIKPEDQKLLDASPLQGTEKQVTWAEKLRKDAIIQARLEASLYGELLTKDNPNGEKLSVDDFKEVSDLIGKYAATKTDAKFWIDRRYNGNQKDLIKPPMTHYVERLAEQNDPRLSDELKKVALEGKSKRIGAGQERKLLTEKYKTIQKPELEGTERQVGWAGKIRDGFLGDAEKQKIEPDSVQKALDSDELKNSKFWIENRDMSMQGNRLSKEGIEKVRTIGGASPKEKKASKGKAKTYELGGKDWNDHLKSEDLTQESFDKLSPWTKKAITDNFESSKKNPQLEPKQTPNSTGGKSAIAKSEATQRKVELDQRKKEIGIPGNDIEYDKWLEDKARSLNGQKKDAIKVKTRGGEILVPGEEYEGLAVHPAKNVQLKEVYNVTHTKTGLSVGEFVDEDQAKKAVAGLLETGVDWKKEDIRGDKNIGKVSNTIKNIRTSDIRQTKKKLFEQAKSEGVEVDFDNEESKKGFVDKIYKHIKRGGMKTIEQEPETQIRSSPKSSRELVTAYLLDKPDSDNIESLEELKRMTKNGKINRKVLYEAYWHFKDKKINNDSKNNFNSNPGQMTLFNKYSPNSKLTAASFGCCCEASKSLRRRKSKQTPKLRRRGNRYA